MYPVAAWWGTPAIGTSSGSPLLRLVSVSYWNFHGEVERGPLVLHEKVADDVLWVFRRMFRAVRNDLMDRGIKRIAVWCLSENERARAFYERLGGKIIAETSDRVAGSSLTKVAYLFR